MAAKARKPTERITDFRSLARRLDPDIDKPEVVYDFPRARKFLSTDRSGRSGVYANDQVGWLINDTDFSGADWTKTGPVFVEKQNIINFPRESVSGVQDESIYKTFAIDPANKTFLGQFKMSGDGTVDFEISNSIDFNQWVRCHLTAIPKVFSLQLKMNGTSASSILFQLKRHGLPGAPGQQFIAGANTAKQVTVQFARLEEITA